MHRRSAIIASLSWPGWSLSAPAQGASSKLLFVGNSLTYFGNLPAVFDALAVASGKASESQMLVKGGAVLNDRVRDKSVDRALKATHYDYLVLQERGGDVPGFLGAKAKSTAESAARSLAQLAKARGSVPIYLGTYQGNVAASTQVVNAESQLAQSLEMPYVSVSDRLMAGLKSQPGLRWFHDDGMHPGPDLTLLQAVLLFNAIFKLLPASRPITISAPIYGPGAHFFPPALASQRASLDKPTEQSQTYSAEVVEHVLTIARTTAE